ncbi:golgin subfamily A member 6 19 [Labeo rohita]|uniref:Golgin subfamily A member 6 19 n=1 Tax=Labeo rohita TaxID=84645 RepID=A0A498NJ82_LABRO|nr:golgin subfamily A member 6 19 [Labeo rohita]
MEAVKLPSIPGPSHARDLCPHPPKEVKRFSAHQNIISVSENTRNSGQMEAVKLPSIPGPSHARDLCPRPPPQKNVKSFSAHQNIISVSENTRNSGQMEALKLPSIPRPSHARGLCPLPPPQEKVNGSDLSAERQYQFFGLRSREYKPVEVRAFIREGRRGRPTRGKTHLLPQKKWMRCFETLSDYTTGIIQKGYVEMDTINKNKAFQTLAEQSTQEITEMSEKERVLKKDWAEAEGLLRDSNPLRVEQEAQDLLVTWLQEENEKKILARKIYVVEDTIELRELLIHEARERERRNRRLSPEELEKLTSNHVDSTRLSEEEGEVFMLINNEKDRLEHYKGRMEEEMHTCASRIKCKQKTKKAVKADMDIIKSERVARRKKNETETELLCDELVNVQEACEERAYSPAYPLMMLQQFEECILYSLDSIESMPAERVCKLQKQICKQKEIREQELKRLHIEALLEERRQKRLARALCPPVKPTGKKLMQRSQPLKSIQKRGAGGNKD